MNLEQQSFDQNALSRQLAVYGQETQLKLMALRIFIHGLSGLGIEIVKNLVLAGPRKVTLYDSTVVSLPDLGRNFYCKSNHIGALTRAQASIDQLKELNHSVAIDIANTDSLDYITNNFDFVLVIDNYDRKYLTTINNACRSKDIGFIYAGNLGLYGFTFVDFGTKHTILDPNGQECLSAHIAGITRDEKGLVFLHENKKHGFSDGDTVIFREVKGMQEINGKMFKISVKSPEAFTIGDTRGYSEYKQGGIATDVKVPILEQFDSLEKSLRCPYPPGSKEMPIANWQKFGLPEQLHIILNSLLNFYSKHQRLPRPLNQDDLFQMKVEVKHYLQSMMKIEGEEFKVDSVEDKLIENVVLYADTQISPCASFWGGIIAQQVVKVTGKFSPLRQWLHHEFFQALPSKPVFRALVDNRYRDYHILFGSQFVEKVAGSNTFLIGAGALGCQFIKMMALMGFATDYGSIHVTDDDRIEVSNLNRQFLFRRHHVGLSKCKTACKVGNSINPQAKFNTYTLRVSPQEQNIFDDGFWSDLDLVINAVDNVKARQYIDNQCVWFQKPLFQSGTLGTKCHSQIILPHVTASYNDLVDPPEQSIPLCTLKNFPYEIEHTIQWARDYFQGVFAEASADLTAFYEQEQLFLKEISNKFSQNPTILKSKLQSIFKLHKANQQKSYKICVKLALEIFQQVFNHQIKQLLVCLPPDHISEQTKKPFWSGLKRVPTPLEFDVYDPKQVQLVQAAANIYATIFGIPMVQEREQVIEIARKIPMKPFVAKANAKIQTGEEVKPPTNPATSEDEEQIIKLHNLLSSQTLNQKLKANRIEFQKDDPANYHIEFISGIANLRARNYRIEEADNFKVKLIAGKIIPAIATTTAMVVGAVGIEIIKYLLEKEPSCFKNLTANLALPLWVFNDIIEATVYKDTQNDPLLFCPVKAIPKPFTKWDKIRIKSSFSVKQLINHLETTYSITISMITYGTIMIFPYYGSNTSRYLSLKIHEAIEQITRKAVPKKKKSLAIGVSAQTKDKIYCQMPMICYQL